MNLHGSTSFVGRAQPASGMAINNARLIQIVKGHFHIDLITNGNADKIFPHLAGDMGEDFVPIGQRHPEHRAGQHLRNVPGQFNWFFFRHNVAGPFTIAILRKKINFFHLKNEWTIATVRLHFAAP